MQQAKLCTFSGNQIPALAQLIGRGVRYIICILTILHCESLTFAVVSVGVAELVEVLLVRVAGRLKLRKKLKLNFDFGWRETAVSTPYNTRDEGVILLRKLTLRY